MRTYHGKSKTKIYDLWVTMIQRCENPNATGYAGYGGNGVTVSDNWHSFEDFYSDMGDRPAGCSLDRIDGNLGYSKENCRWATHSEQLANRRRYERTTQNTSGVFGVYWKKSHNKFVARTTVDGKRRYLGFFNTLAEASKAMRDFNSSING